MMPAPSKLQNSIYTTSFSIINDIFGGICFSVSDFALCVIILAWRAKIQLSNR